MYTYYTYTYVFTYVFTYVHICMYVYIYIYGPARPATPPAYAIPPPAPPTQQGKPGGRGLPARTLQPAGREVSQAPPGQQHTAANKARSTRSKQSIHIYTYII